MYHGAASAHTEVVDKILKQDSWAWARESAYERKLKEANNDLRSSMSEWHLEFVATSDLNSMKRTHDAKTTISQAETFAQLKPKIDKVAAVTKSLLRAHSELMKA